jgi:hypothetical protein
MTCSVHADTSCLLTLLSRHSTEVINTLSPPLKRAAVDSYADALHVVFICQAALAFIMLLCCLPIQESFLPYVFFFVCLPLSRTYSQ